MINLLINEIEFSKHFIEDVLPKRGYLTVDVLIDIINTPIKIETQSNGNIKIWGYSSKYDKYIRVVMLEDKKTVLTAFFDRDFPKKGL